MSSKEKQSYKYTKSSNECLQNAYQLIADARLLFENGSLGSSQGLAVTALEEAGKALLCELTDLNYVGIKVLKHAMRDHVSKRLILQAIKNGKLLYDHFFPKRKICNLNMAKFNILYEELKDDIKALGVKRNEGFYVQINTNDGSVKSSPKNINEAGLQKFIDTISQSIDISNFLCRFFQNLKTKKSNSTLNNLKIFENKEKTENITIQWDEI